MICPFAKEFFSAGGRVPCVQGLGASVHRRDEQWAGRPDSRVSVSLHTPHTPRVYRGAVSAVQMAGNRMNTISASMDRQFQREEAENEQGCVSFVRRGQCCGGSRRGED